MSMLIHWFISAAAIMVAAYLIPGVNVTLWAAFVLAVVLALINIFIKPVIGILTLPINILTLGIFSLVINALLILLAASFVEGFAVDGFFAALFFSVVLSIINGLFGGLGNKH